MSTSEVTSEPYRLLPSPLYFAHQATKRLTVVYGGLADYYGFYDVQEFTGTDSQSEAQLADPANWRFFAEHYYVEAHGDKAPQIFALVEGTTDTIEYVTAQHPGPFRLEGIPPFAGSGYEFFPTLGELVAKQLVLQGPQFRGRIMPSREGLSWVAFTEEPFGSGECPWEGVELNLGVPLDTYVYFQGRRATAEEGAGHGTHTLWRQVDGARNYYVETAPVQPFTAGYPKLTLVTPEQLRQWYKFEPAALD